MRFFRSLYLNNRLFAIATGLAFCFVLAFVFGAGVWVPKILFYLLLGVMATDVLLLYRTTTGMTGGRTAPERLSNGDENEIVIHLQNLYTFPVTLRVFDELPHQFQKRDLTLDTELAAGTEKSLRYVLRPVKRGEYNFGHTNVLASSPLGLVSRRFRWSEPATVPVYPSFLQMRKYELMAIHNRLTDVGIKKIRRIGQNQEFEMIREYVGGDDIRTLNWKATARKMRLMVNQFQDERSQQVYAVIDKGRIMRMPFNGMSLLDYAINASLVICNIAHKKYDKPGLITFQDKVSAFLPASRKNDQIGRLMEVLYHQKTSWLESDFSRLHLHVRQKINQRSLLLLFTNFEGLYGMQRQLPYLRNLAARHVLVVVFFENTEVKSVLETPAKTLEEIYHKAIAEKFTYEKKLIVHELNRHGIHTVLTAPEQLTIQTINKYLELKARQLI